MSYPQAFHTSCRSGLSGQTGFQFNAASPSLDRTVLTQLAAAHAGYHVPRDMPLEPAAADLARFPIALKVAPVDGVGAVVSRTIYVGREFRGRDGAPDEGRFGNYFSHIVVGNGDGEPFEGLLGIELWDAPHWTDFESAEPGLPELDRLQPGPLDVERVAGILSAVPRGVTAAVLDAAVQALDGGPRVVLVDAESARAAAWIGWISYALPAAQAQRLTFTTFDGRPRYADDVHVCVTTPACDTAFAPHEIERSVQLLDVNATPTGRPSLYARVALALALAHEATDALATAVRAVPADADGVRRGAWLAVAGGLTELVEGHELPAVVSLLRELTELGQVARAAATATELPADTAIDRATLPEWAALHRAARERPADEDSRSLAATALARIIPFAGALPDEIAPVAPGTPTQPAVGNLAPWLSAVEAAAGAPSSGPLIRDGLRLGLVGVNAAVDRRLARALITGLAHAPVRETLKTIGRRSELEHIIVAVTEALAERHDALARQHLREIGRHPVARATLRRRAEEERSFERLAAWLRAEVDENPSQRPFAAGKLAPLAVGEREHAEIRELWGPGGPRDEREHVDLLSAYLNGGGVLPLDDGLRALAQLMKRPLTHAKVTDALGATLTRDARLHQHPSYAAWWVVVTEPGARYPFGEWVRQARAAIWASDVDVPDARWREVCHRVFLEVIHQRRSRDYAQGIAELRSSEPPYLDDGLVDVLTELFRGGQDNAHLIADLFETWRRIPFDGPALVNDVLARASAAVRRREIEKVDEYLPPWLCEEWKAWMERRPRSSVARAFGRRGRRSKDGDPA